MWLVENLLGIIMFHGRAFPRSAEKRATAMTYVWRDDLSDTFDESVRVLLPVERQSVCLVRATVPDPL